MMESLRTSPTNLRGTGFQPVETQVTNLYHGAACGRSQRSAVSLAATRRGARCSDAPSRLGGPKDRRSARGTDRNAR